MYFFSCLQVDGPIARGGGLVSRRAYKRQFTVFVLSFEHVHLNKWHWSIPSGQKVNCIFRDGWSHVNTYASLNFRLVSCKQICTSLSLHCFNEIRVLVCPWVSEDAVKHSWELLNFSLRGCLHDTSSLYAFHSDTSSPQCPLASLYLLHDYSTKSHNSASHTWVSSYWYHVNMV